MVTIEHPGHDVGPHLRKVRSFVQRSGRLSPRLQRHWDQYGEQYLLELRRIDTRMSVDPELVIDLPTAFGRTAPTIMEIGSGRGEMITAAAASHPQHNYLGCEVFTQGVAGILGRLGQEEVRNVRIAHADATALLRHNLPAGSLEEIWVFFPDPWHKLRHNKRRLITDEFATLVARALAPGGTWRVATDWPDYGAQIAAVIAASPDFDGGAAPRFEQRPLTRFEAKAHAEGRTVTDFTAVRRP